MFRKEHGQALVETAVAFPLLLAILLGTAEIARMTYVATTVSNAALAGVQYAAMSGGQLNQRLIQEAAQDDAGLPLTTTYTVTCAWSATVGAAQNQYNSIPPLEVSPTCAIPHVGAKSPPELLIMTVTVTANVSVHPTFHLVGMPRNFLFSQTASEEVLPNAN
jgi:Flp pilus assembly protein TadG